jgi:hypothetical protein
MERPPASVSPCVPLHAGAAQEPGAGGQPPPHTTEGLPLFSGGTAGSLLPHHGAEPAPRALGPAVAGPLGDMGGWETRQARPYGATGHILGLRRGAALPPARSTRPAPGAYKTRQDNRVSAPGDADTLVAPVAYGTGRKEVSQWIRPGRGFCCLLPVRQPAPRVVHRAVPRGNEASAQTVPASRSANCPLAAPPRRFNFATAEPPAHNGAHTKTAWKGASRRLAVYRRPRGVGGRRRGGGAGARAHPGAAAALPPSQSPLYLELRIAQTGGGAQ